MSDISLTRHQVGMLSTGLPKVNLQYESKDALRQLVKAVKANLPEDADDDRLKPPSPSDNNQIAFQVSWLSCSGASSALRHSYM